MLNVPKEWWHELFTGLFVEAWLQAIPEQQTQREVDFIQKALKVRPGARLLDVPCGGGRHALPLAAAGYQMTGVDISPEFLAAARARAADRNLAVTWVHKNMSQIDWSDAFDGVFCFGNAFGYDDDEGSAAFLRAVYRSLKPGARFALDYPVVLEALLPRFQERNWHRLGDVLFLEDEHYNPATGRTDTEYTTIKDGKIEKRLASHRSYTYRQIRELLAAAGFEDVEALGSLDGEPYQFRSTGLFLVGMKQ
jgi:SAM-dependent methyltransferase